MEETIRSARRTQGSGLWEGKLKAMEGCAAVLQRDRLAWKRFIDLYAFLQSISPTRKDEPTLLLLKSTCCINLAHCAETRLDTLKWCTEARTLALSLSNDALLSYIDQFKQRSSSKPPQHPDVYIRKRVNTVTSNTTERHVSPGIQGSASGGDLRHSGSQMSMQQIAPHLTVSQQMTPHKSVGNLAKLVFKSPPEKPTGRGSSSKRKKSTVEDAYSRIEKLLQNPPKPKKRLLKGLNDSRRTVSTVGAGFVSKEVTMEPISPRSPKMDYRRVNVIQAWWRRMYMKREKKATVIQSHWRRFREERKYQRIKRLNAIRKNAASRKIQTAWKQFLTVKNAKIAVKSLSKRYFIRVFHKVANEFAIETEKHRNALCIQSWFRQKFALVTLWEEYEAKKASESISEYPASVSTKPETSAYSLSTSRMDLQDMMSTDRSMSRRPTKQFPKAAILIQKAFKGYSARQSYRSLVQTTVKLQSWVREMIAVRRWKNTQKCILAIQRTWKGALRRRVYTKQKAAIVKIQCVYRGFIVRKRVQTQLSALQFLQAWFKRKIHRRCKELNPFTV